MQPLGNSKSNLIGQSHMPSMMQANQSKSGNKIISTMKSMKFFVFLVVVLQLVIIFILVNPINLLNQLSAVQIINKVSSKVVVPPNEVPQVIAQVGDLKNLPDADALKKENAIQAEIYKDAQNGDYVLLYSSKMIIYRSAEDKVIYEGDTPASVLKKTQEGLVTKVVSKAKDLGLISASSEENPQLSIISDVAALKNENPVFYTNAANNDVIALFQQSGKILLYRPDTDTVINSGTFNVSIQ